MVVDRDLNALAASRGANEDSVLSDLLDSTFDGRLDQEVAAKEVHVAASCSLEAVLNQRSIGVGQLYGLLDVLIGHQNPVSTVAVQERNDRGAAGEERRGVVEDVLNFGGRDFLDVRVVAHLDLALIDAFLEHGLDALTHVGVLVAERDYLGHKLLDSHLLSLTSLGVVRHDVDAVAYLLSAVAEVRGYTHLLALRNVKYVDDSELRGVDGSDVVGDGPAAADTALTHNGYRRGDGGHVDGVVLVGVPRELGLSHQLVHGVVEDRHREYGRYRVLTLK